MVLESIQDHKEHFWVSACYCLESGAVPGILEELEGISEVLPRLFKEPKKALPFHLIVVQKNFPRLCVCVNGVLIPTFIPLGQHFEALFKSTTFRVEERKV